MATVRTRFAPSPTGFFHIGNAKTAMYNWLFARRTNGVFILRLEDTDIERSKDEYADILAEGLDWLGLEWDEGPAVGRRPERGDYGPYRQSQRKDIYRREARRLLETGAAYRCFCSKDELEAERERAKAEKRIGGHRDKCRNLTPDDVAAKGDTPYAIRFKTPDGETVVNDVIQGPVRTDNCELDDFVILRANGDPVFHLSVVVDDGLMKVTHVIRGDDHLTNAAKHVLLFKALGYPLPEFAHHPLVHDEHGRKYSKRLHGANVLDWREDGYLPETLVNYMALLGWTADADTDRELYTPRELIEVFSLDRLGQSAGRFDMKKIQWLNGQHIRRLPPEELRDRLLPILQNAGFDTASKSEDWLTEMARICQEKLRTLNDIVAQTDFFFVEPPAYEEKGVAKHWMKQDALEHMNRLRDAMACVEPWQADALKTAFQALCEETGLGLGRFVHPVRLALTGKTVGPGLFELAELLGRETCLARMDKAIDCMKSMEMDRG